MNKKTQAKIQTIKKRHKLRSNSTKRHMQKVTQQVYVNRMDARDTFHCNS